MKNSIRVLEFAGVVGGFLFTATALAQPSIAPPKQMPIPPPDPAAAVPHDPSKVKMRVESYERAKKIIDDRWKELKEAPGRFFEMPGSWVEKGLGFDEYYKAIYGVYADGQIFATAEDPFGYWVPQRFLVAKGILDKNWSEVVGGSLGSIVRDAPRGNNGRYANDTDWYGVYEVNGGYKAPEVDLGYYAKYQNGVQYVTPQGSAFVVSSEWLTTYLDDGGPAGLFGFPTSMRNDIPESDGEYQEFEGRTLYWWPGMAQVTKIKRLRIVFRGLHCFGEQQNDGAGRDGDEPYVVFARHVREHVMGVSHGLPELTSRVFKGVRNRNSVRDELVLYEGPPAQLALAAILMEQDNEGQEGKYARAAKQQLDQQMEGAPVAGMAIAGPPGALAGEALRQVWHVLGPTIEDQMGTAVKDVFGLKDDKFGAHAILFTIRDMIEMSDPNNSRYPDHSWSGLDFDIESPLLSDKDASYKLYYRVELVE